MLASGAVGGAGLGGGIPWGSGPVFAVNAAIAEMPWRAAGGEAHPMTTTQRWQPTEDPASLLIFEQLLRETATVPEALATTDLAADPTVDLTVAPPTQPADDHGWSADPTVTLPVLGQREPPQQPSASLCLDRSVRL